MDKRLDVSRGTTRYRDLHDYLAQSGKRKQFVARQELDIHPPRLSELLNPDVYCPRVDDELLKRIAELLNQPPEYVRKIYPKAA